MATVARSGVARSGDTRSGDTTAATTTFNPTLSIVIDGTDRTMNTDIGDLQITLGLDSEASQMNVTVVPRGGFTLERGNEVRIYLGGDQVGVPLFAGHILTIQERVDRQADDVIYEIGASDYRWLLDRYKLVSEFYWNRGVNSIVNDLLAKYADPNSGFTAGYLDANLGTVNFIELDNLRVTECLEKLAQTVDGGAFWEVDAEKRVSIYKEPDDEGNTITVPNTGGAWRQLSRDQDLESVVNQVIFIGGGSRTTARVEQGATEIPVEETGWYNPSGGKIRCPCNTVDYTGLSVNSGAGTITGVTNMLHDVPQGTSCWNLFEANDTTAQTNLASDLGGSQSGIATYEASDHRFGYDRTEQAAESLLDELSAPNTRIRFHQVPDIDADDATLTHIRPGRLMTISLTSPVTMSGSFRIRSVRMEPHHRRADGSIVFRRHIDAATNRRVFANTLATLIEGNG